MNRFPSSAEIGRRLLVAARAVAPLLVLTFVAGFAFGELVHRANDRLATLLLPWRTGGVPSTPPAAQNDSPRSLPVMLPAPTISPERLTVEELRRIARQRLGAAARPGGRRIAQARRADLLAAIT